MSDLISALQPILDETLSYLIYAVIAYAAVLLRRWTGVQVDRKAQDDLHRAALTAARAALARGMTQTQAINHIESYVQRSVPGAVRRLKPSPVIMNEIAKAKLAEAA